MIRLMLGLGLVLSLAGAVPANAEIKRVKTNFELSSCRYHGQTYIEGSTITFPDGVLRACNHAGQWVEFTPSLVNRRIK